MGSNWCEKWDCAIRMGLPTIDPLDHTLLDSLIIEYFAQQPVLDWAVVSSSLAIFCLTCHPFEVSVEVNYSELAGDLFFWYFLISLQLLMYILLINVYDLRFKDCRNYKRVETFYLRNLVKKIQNLLLVKVICLRCSQRLSTIEVCLRLIGSHW